MMFRIDFAYFPYTKRMVAGSESFYCGYFNDFDFDYFLCSRIYLDMNIYPWIELRNEVENDVLFFFKRWNILNLNALSM